MSVEQQVQNFMNANFISPVVAGRAIEQDRVYTLADGSVHRLGLAACRLLPEGYPRWQL